MKENKFVMGEEEDRLPNASPTVTTSHKKPTRHHVKRRSSGRVHVAKLAPMARAHAAHTDTEADLLDDSSLERPVMRRSQSQRSLHRMSFDRKGFATLTPRRKSIEKAEESPADEEQDLLDKQQTKINTSSTHSTSNPASLTHRVIAAPIEQTFNATAKNLVVPKKAVYPKIASPLKADTQTTLTKKQFLRSQFLTDEQVPKRTENVPFHPTRSISRTQQKLMLQRQQSQVQDETSPIHPRNMQKINKELEILSRETKCIKRYQDPMKDSLIRCLENLMKPPKVNRNQLGANQHSMSSSVIPTVIAAAVANNYATIDKKSYVPHMEQRQIAHRHHHLKTIALSRANQYHLPTSMEQQSSNDKHVLGFSWNATTAFLDRMFNTSSK